LALIERAATHREGLTLEVFPHRVVPLDKSDPALANERRAEMDSDVNDFARVVHVLARLDVDTFDLHTGAGVRAGGGPTLRRMSVFYVCITAEQAAPRWLGCHVSRCSVVGASHVSAARGDLSNYQSDGWADRAMRQIVVLPASASEVAAVVAAC